MLYQVNGKNHEGKNYSTRINAKNPQQASKLAIGNLIQVVYSIISIDSKGNVKNAWEIKNNKLIKTL